MGQKFINVHCHILNFDFIPNSFFKVYSPIREWMLRSAVTRFFLRAVCSLPFIKGYLVFVLSMLRKDIKAVAGELSREMDASGMVLATPLMMDLELAAFNRKPEYPYRYQVELISEIAAEYPGKLMPFVMFDPRRKAAADMVIEALEKKGFLGVKMYPPLGYHPDPGSFYNDTITNNELAKVYGHCVEHEIPITVHCSKGGAYSGDLVRIKKLIHLFCQPSGWRPVLEKYPPLRINFGHFGGCDDLVDFPPHDADSWTWQVAGLIEQHDNVYADISYHDKALDKEKSSQYFQRLNLILESGKVRKRVIFGTDWFMARYRWTEAKYVNAFRKLDKDILELIAFENPMRFLFSNRTLPGRILDFYKDKGIQKNDLPDWMQEYFGW